MKGKKILGVLLVVSITTGLAYISAKKYTDYKISKQMESLKVAQDEIKDTLEDREDNLNTSKYTVKAEEGYVSYVIMYSDLEANRMNISSTPCLIKYEDKVYSDIEQAKQDGVIKDYIEDDVYYFQVKVGSQFAWYINPKDVTEIENWTDENANVTLSVDPKTDYNGKILKQNIIIDYSNGVDISFEQAISKSDN